MTLAEKFELGNEEAARIILSDPIKYEGLPLTWARLWLERHSRLGAAGLDPDLECLGAAVQARHGGHEEQSDEVQRELF